ncbi:ATP-binding protein [Bacteroidales bacterium OttesenSCG-928-L03]|nr:ATP-binding protein [Bacteroidales bacterium OttesenSCG-928-L03]
MSQFINDYEKLVKLHTKNSYDLFIHLPIEFPISQDGHRPVNENFRILSNDYLLNTLEELKIPHIIVGGSIEERLFKIVTELGLSPKMSIEEAVSLAKSEAHKRNSIEIEYDKSLKNKI